METNPEISDEIRRFERQYAENPDSLVFARLADLHRKAGRPERALEILEDGLERHPDYLSAHIVRARSLRALGRDGEAEEVFHHVLELDGENLVALRSLAEMAWERGDDARARARLEELLQLDPRNEEARELLREIRESPAGPRDLAAAEEAAAEPDQDPVAEPEEDARVAEDDPFARPGDDEAFGAEDDPFAGTNEPAETAEDAGFGAEDDPFTGTDEPAETAEDAGFGAEDDPFAGTDEPAETAEDTGFGAEDDPFARGAEEPDREEDASGAEASGFIEPTPGSRTFDVEPPDEGAPEAEPSGTEEPETEPSGDTRPPAPDEPGAEEPVRPAVGPPSEAEELHAEIEELRMQAEREADLSDADEDLATETLAELYEAQGFYREAVEMYEELAAQRPGDEDLRRRLERARQALRETGGTAERSSAPVGTDPAAEEAPSSGSAAADELQGDPAAPARTAAEELRAVLRGEASAGERGTYGP